MDAKDLIRAGRLADARKQLTEEVKASPADLSKRTLLFQVLAFCGEWDKAERHLDVIASRNPGSETGVQVYKNLIRAERERTEVAALERRPSFLPEAPSYLESYIIALEHLVAKDIDRAKEIFDQIEDIRPTVAGTIKGKPFSGFKDTDAYLADFLEAIVYERYVWIPIESIRELSIENPKTLFDLLWIPARLTSWEGLTMSCYLPVIYPGSFRHEDDRVKLGRITDWVHLGGPFSRGVGQHVFEIGDDEVPILEIQEAFFDSQTV
jgi:type VI secretion system protein ImpE